LFDSSEGEGFTMTGEMELGFARSGRRWGSPVASPWPREKKLFGWFGGGRHITATADYFERRASTPSAAFAVVVAGLWRVLRRIADGHWVLLDRLVRPWIVLCDVARHLSRSTSATDSQRQGRD